MTRVSDDGWSFFNTTLPAILAHPALVSRMMATTTYFYALLQGWKVAGIDLDTHKLLKRYTSCMLAPVMIVVSTVDTAFMCRDFNIP